MLKQTPLSNASFRRNLVQSLWMLRGDERLSVQMMLCATAASPQSCRFQSSLCSTTRSSTSQHDPLHASAARQKLNRRPIVNPNLRQRRPHVNGQPVAFHVHDLIPPPTATATAAVAGHALLSSEQLQKPFQSQVSRKREYESDLVVVLDMDECLIHSQFLSNPTMAQVLAHQLQCRRRKETSVSGSTVPSPSEVDHFRVQLPDGGDLVHVNVRPGLENFLNEITSRYETHIFTAAVSIYANPVLDQFDPDRTKFAGRWYREHCTYDGEYQAYIKNLSVLPLQNMARAVLIDNNPLSFLSNPSNGILVPSFYNDPEDDSLEAVKQLLTELESYDDVRPVLEDRFGMTKALEEILAGSSSSSLSSFKKKLYRK
ncbi:hypothetical protein ACA910_008127 [Epithemia clementina (nom. ined.)]